MPNDLLKTEGNMANKKNNSILKRLRKRTLAQITIEMAMPRTAASARGIKAARKTKAPSTSVENLLTSRFQMASRNQPIYAV
jgi:hypothetical protein